MAKLEYSLIEMEIVEFDAEDVITTSDSDQPYVPGGDADEGGLY